MLAYLDALLAALAARNIAEIDRLLAHPLARILSPDALADATAERRAAGAGSPSVAPLRLLQLRYRTAQLLGEAAGGDALDRSDPTGGAERAHMGAQAHAWADGRSAIRQQMELPLSA